MGKRLFPSLRTRTVLTMVVMFVFMLVMVIVIMNTLLLSSIKQLEHKYISERMNQISIGIGFELNDLQKTAVDWAEWNDPYQFVEDGNQEFIDENLGAYFFENLRLDAMVYMNQSGEIVYAEQINAEASALEPVPDTIREQLKQLIGDNLDATKRLKGVLKVPGGAMLFATNPILTSNGDGPVHGNLVVYRYLNDKEIDYLSEIIGNRIVVEESIIQVSPEILLKDTMVRRWIHKSRCRYSSAAETEDREEYTAAPESGIKLFHVLYHPILVILESDTGSRPRFYRIRDWQFPAAVEYADIFNQQFPFGERLARFTV